MLLYLHGFNSSPASHKARLLRERLGDRAFAAPELPPSPASAAVLLDELIAAHPDACVVGSSLGGFYATWLAERHALRAVLLNPALRPYELLAGYVGRQKNLYTGIDYDFTARHLGEMRALEVTTITRERYLVILQTGDEVLDYREALTRFAGAQLVVDEGGDHGLSDFAAYVDRVIDFCGCG